MKAVEEPALIDCDGDRMLGIFHLPESAASRAVIILVGGPQYRIGSHRQFLLLARYLAAQGTPVLRIDYRGMGDSEGVSASFENTADDIRVAVDATFVRLPGLTEVVIWGLCDAASGALMYAHRDARIVGLVLANPWVRTDESLDKVYIKHYYWKRFIEPDFWRKIFSGRVNIVRSCIDFVASLLRALKGMSSDGRSSGDTTTDAPFPIRMREGLRRFDGQVLFVISGDDLTAAEFCDLVKSSSEWQTLVSSPSVQWADFPPANHTFSRREWRDQVSNRTLDWLRSW